MSYLEYKDITSNLPFLKEFDFIEVRQTLNNHAELLLRGLVDETEKGNCVKRAGSEQMIQISHKNGKVLFTGIIQSIEVTAVNHVYFIEIRGTSYSFLMDVKRTNRSYQNVNLTYEEILQEKMVEYSKGSIINTISSEQTINRLLVQYQETDWQFIKRLASHFNQPIIPSVKQEGVKLFFGIPEGRSIGEFTNFNYRVGRDISRYLLAASNHNSSLTEADTMEYTITTGEDFDIGDLCTFQQMLLYIKEKQALYKDGMLNFTYKLSTRNGLSQAGLFGETIQGISMKGKVLASIGDKVKVHLEIDQEQDIATACLLPYATPYTAEGSTGWYCMPEVGDTVQVYFPGNIEAKAVAMNSIRSGNNEDDKITNPDIKYFRTADGKELKFSQDEILITCISGTDKETGETKYVYICLNQNDGIEIISTESIYVKSDKHITLKAEESIKVLAEEEIRFKCKSSEIRIDSMVDICGEVVKVN